MRKISAMMVVWLVCVSVWAQIASVRTIQNTYHLQPFDGPLANPHKGFTVPTGGTWSFSPVWEYAPGGERNNQAWNLVTHGSGYQRWDKLNPAKGVYDWTDLDKLLDACEKHGITYALRVFPYSTSKGQAKLYTVAEDYDFTPRYVYEEGARKGSAKITYNGAEYTLSIPVWDDPVYLKAHKEFAAALAEKYDGDPRIEYIDIRTFGNWGEWHVSHMEGTQIPSEEVQKDIISYYASIFHHTLLVLPSSGAGEVYEHALSLGVTKRDDGLVGTPNREQTLLPAYEANLPTIGENLGPYTLMLTYTDVIPGGYLKWTPERWVNVIKGGHLTYYVLDQDSDAGYRFYSDNKALADSMSKVIGYNFRLTDVSLRSEGDSSSITHTLRVTLQNTGVAPCFFDLHMVAELVDASGEDRLLLGEPMFIPKGTFKDGMTQDFTFVRKEESGKRLADNGSAYSLLLSLYESEEAYRRGENPTVRFDNEGILPNKKLLLPACPHTWSPWDTIHVATETEAGLRRHLCTQEGCGSYEEESIPSSAATGMRLTDCSEAALFSYAIDHTIHVIHAAGQMVSLFNSKGECCGQKWAATNDIQFSVQQKGLYFIVVDTKTMEVVVR